MSEKLQTTEFSVQGFPSVPSLYREMYHSRDYADRDENSEYKLNNHYLRMIGEFWALRKHDPDTSPRAVGDIDKLLGRVSFEMVMRNNEMNKSE